MKSWEMTVWTPSTITFVTNLPGPSISVSSVFLLNPRFSVINYSPVRWGTWKVEGIRGKMYINLKTKLFFY